LRYTRVMVPDILERKADIATLCQEHGVQRLYIFGSATYGAALSEVHDLDFLVQFEPMPPVQYAHNYFYLAEKLESLFQKPVDLVEMETLQNPYFKEAVDESKVPVYEPS
jgi:predicted nucleotidyltransferase